MASSRRAAPASSHFAFSAASALRFLLDLPLALIACGLFLNSSRGGRGKDAGRTCC